MRKPASSKALALVALVLLAGAPAATASAATVIATPSAPTARAASAPGQAKASGPTGADRYADPLGDLGGGSPTCQVTLDPVAARNCRSSGTVESRYPLSSYGFDVQVGFSLTHMERTFLGALQDVAALVWMAFVYAVKGVLLLLEWAFSLDLLGSAMGSVRHTLAFLHDQVIGQPWFLAALSVAGLWGIWRGLVQRQASQTMIGLLTSVVLMVAGLVVLAHPDDTVGRASQLANQASLGVLSAATGHDINKPTAALADSMIGVFDGLVHDPWCALEFGSVKYCDQHAPHSAGLTNADVWLQYPAGSDQRTALFHLLKGQPEGGNKSLLQKATGPILSVAGIGGGKPPSVPDNVKKEVAKDPARATLQDSGGTVPRFALLALIVIGMTGAIALLGIIGVRLLLAAVMALVLLLFAPAVLLAPAFGESGRATFIAWAQRLLGAIVAKLIYALFLAVVLAAAATIRRLDVGWFATWLLQIAFWWGVLLKRHELIGFVSAGTPNHQTQGAAGRLLGQAYYGVALGRTARNAATRLTPPVARATTAVTRTRAERREARATATAHVAREELATQATNALTAQHAGAQERVTERRSLEKESRAIDRRLAGYDETHATARATRTNLPTPTEEQQALLHRRREITQRLDQSEMRAAPHITSHAARTTARIGSPIGAGDLAEHRRTRAQDHEAGLPVDHDRNLQAAGINPDRYRGAPEPERNAIRTQVSEHLQRERGLLAATGDVDDKPPAPRELRLDPSRLRRRTRAERDQLRAERVQRKVRTTR